MDDTDRESFAFVYEASDESESTVYDNSNDYNADDKAGGTYRGRGSCRALSLKLEKSRKKSSRS
ncbi:MAG: hypothetical protein ACLR7D_12625 [Lachnospira eligens]